MRDAWFARMSARAWLSTWLVADKHWTGPTCRGSDQVDARGLAPFSDIIRTSKGPNDPVNGQPYCKPNVQLECFIRAPRGGRAKSQPLDSKGIATLESLVPKFTSPKPCDLPQNPRSQPSLLDCSVFSASSGCYSNPLEIYNSEALRGQFVGDPPDPNNKNLHKNPKYRVLSDNSPSPLVVNLHSIRGSSPVLCNLF